MDSPEKGYDIMICHKHQCVSVTAYCPYCRVIKLEDNLRDMCTRIKENVNQPDFYHMGFDIRQSDNSVRVSHRLLSDG